MSNLFKKVTSAVAGLAIVFSIVSPIAGVSAAYTSLEAANKLATLGVIVDQSSNPADYRLGDTLTRREHTKVAMNLASCQAVEVVDTCNGSFSDMDSSDWGCKYAETALSNGFVAANATFNPGRDVSKAEALKMIMNATGVEKSGNAMWEAAYVEGAVSAGVISESFSDYTAAASRGWIFQAAAEAVELCGAEEEDEDDLLGSLLDGLTGDDDDEEDTSSEEDDSSDDVVVSGDDEAMLSLSPETPSNGLVAVNTPRSNMLAFDITSGSSDVTLDSVTLYHVGLGDRGDVNDVEIYNSNNESVSKSKSFSNNDLDISFDNDVVVKAGETQTFMITANIAGSGALNTTYQIELSAVEASSTVTGGPLVGAALTPTEVSNTGLLSIKEDTASDTVTVGEEVTLAGFSIEEKNDNEDVLIKTITLHQNGSVGDDYLEDLSLEADGEVVASDLMVNSDDELVINLDYVLEADEKVDFELRGVASGDVSETVHFEFESDSDIYAVGVSTGFNIGFEGGDEPSTANVADEETIDGAEIDAVFDRSDIDETKVDVDDVLVGTFTLTANSNDYEVTEITVTVTGDALSGATTSSSIIDDIYLDGSSFDSVTLGAGPSLIYVFEDINLSQGVAEVLDLEFDVTDDVSKTGTSLTFDIEVTEIEDDENNITYTSSSTPDLNDIMSSNSFETQTIDVESATFTLTQTSVNDRELVLGNGVETVLYKGKVSVGDSDDVELRSIDFTEKTTASGVTVDIDDIIDNATLNIGGTTYDADVDSDSVDFTSINHIFAAGADNVEVLVTATLKDDDSVTSGETLTIELLSANVDLEDSDGEDLAGANITLTTGSNDTTTTLLDNGNFFVRVINDEDSDDSLENTVLAGESNVVIAELEIEAEYEDMRVKDLVFTVSGATDFSDTLDSVSLVSGSTVLAEGAIVTFSGSTLITFEDDFVISEDDGEMDAELVADLNPITGVGDATSSVAGDIIVTVSAVGSDVTGVHSADDITPDTTGTVGGETVSIVPTIITPALVSSLNDTTTPRISIFSDAGNNTDADEDEIDSTITEIVFSTLGTTDADLSLVYQLVNVDDSTDVITGSHTGTTLTFDLTAFGTASNAVVEDGSTEEFRIVITGATTDDDTLTLTLPKDAITYDADTTTGIVIGLDDEIDFGSRQY